MNYKEYGSLKAGSLLFQDNSEFKKFLIVTDFRVMYFGYINIYLNNYLGWTSDGGHISPGSQSYSEIIKI